MSSLFVLLPPATASATTEFPFASSSGGRTVLNHGSAPAALLPQPTGAGSEVVAVVPAQSVSWHQVELPKGVTRNSPRLRGVLEGLLEERLLDEPETLHFALPSDAAGQVWVAVCDKAWLRGALQVLEAAGRPVSRIVPELSPQGAGVLHAIGEPNSAQLAWASADGVLVLPLSAASAAMLPAQAADAPCLAEPAVAALAEQVLHHKVDLQQAQERWMDAAQSDWDLAQFDLASSSRARAMKKFATGWAELLRAPQWRPVRWGVAMLVVLNVVGLNAWALKERNALQAKRDSVGRTLTQTFPGVKVVVDAPVQMEREVALLRQQTGMASGRDLEAMLAALALAVPPGRSINGVDYNGGELRARGLGLANDTLGPVAAQLKSMGYAATLQGDLLVVAQEATP